MKKLGITEGDWEVIISESSNGFAYVNGVDITIYGELTEIEGTVADECLANAKLIADAGTTANKCGLLPSELLEQRDEMLIFMKTVSNKKMFHQGDFKDMKELILKITKP